MNKQTPQTSIGRRHPRVPKQAYPYLPSLSERTITCQRRDTDIPRDRPRGGREGVVMAVPQQQALGLERLAQGRGRPGSTVQGHLPVLVWEMETRVGRVGSGVAEVEGEKYKDVKATQGRVAYPTGQPRPPTADGVP